MKEKRKRGLNMTLSSVIEKLIFCKKLDGKVCIQMQIGEMSKIRVFSKNQ